MACKQVDLLLGKAVTGAMIKEGNESPCSQVFLVFGDGTVYEFYSPTGEIKGSWMHEAGGMEVARRYLPNRRIIEEYSLTK